MQNAIMPMTNKSKKCFATERMSAMSLFPPTSKRVECTTNSIINTWIEDETIERVENLKGADSTSIHKRLYALDCEWDTERIVETESAIMVLAGTVLGLLRGRKWLVLTGAGGLFLLQHALIGWCPTTPVMRRLGIRTPNEICFEKQLLEELLDE